MAILSSLEVEFVGVALHDYVKIVAACGLQVFVELRQRRHMVQALDSHLLDTIVRWHLGNLHKHVQVFFLDVGY